MKKVKREEPELSAVIIKFFSIRTSKPEEFVDELEKLCEKYSKREDFYFNYSVEG